MVEEERSIFAIFAPSELHARPDGFEQLLFGVFGLIRLEGHERKAAVAAVAGGDVQTARAGVSGFEVMDIIMRGREVADAARRHELAARLAHQKRRLRAGIEGRRRAVDFEVADARLAIDSHSTHAELRMAVRGQDRARRHAPLNNGERHAAKGTPRKLGPNSTLGSRPGNAPSLVSGAALRRTAQAAMRCR